MDTEGQHHFGPVVVGCEGDVVADVVVVVLSAVRQKRRERALLWGGFQRNMSLVLPTYVADINTNCFLCRRDILRRDQYFMPTFDTRCRDISFPFWVNKEMSDISRHFFRRMQLRC